MEDHYPRGLGYTGFHGSILLCLTERTVNLIVPSQHVLLKEAFKTLLGTKRVWIRQVRILLLRAVYRCDHLSAKHILLWLMRRVTNRCAFLYLRSYFTLGWNTSTNFISLHGRETS